MDRTDRCVDRIEIAIGVGSNIGGPLARMRSALRSLETLRFRIRSVSSVYRSAAVGYADQPDFLNAVVVGGWDADPGALLEVTQRIEARAGRVRTFRNAPRTLDLDLLLAPGVICAGANLTLPHPRWRERSFVLAPLSEVVPHWTDPDSGETVVDIWTAARDRLAAVEVIAPPTDLWRSLA